MNPIHSFLIHPFYGPSQQPKYHRCNRPLFVADGGFQGVMVAKKKKQIIPVKDHDLVLKQRGCGSQRLVVYIYNI